MNGKSGGESNLVGALCRHWCRKLAQPVALTGATGFLGSHVLDALLAGGCQVRILVRNPRKLPRELLEKVHIVEGDLLDDGALGRLLAGSGTVLHLAGLVRGASGKEFHEVNAVGTRRLVTQAERAGHPRLVYVSSLAAAGPSPSPEGKSPEDSPEPISAYGRSKLAGEEAVRAYHGPWVILRPPAIYGPRDRDVFIFFRLASSGFVPYPKGMAFLTVAFVEDVVLAVLAAAASGSVARIYHLGEPSPYEMRELLSLLVEAGDVRAKLVSVPRWVFRLAGWFGDVLHILGWQQLPMTSDKTRELLARHWTAKTASSLAELQLPEPKRFSQGARETWAWYRQKGLLPHATIKGDGER
ncbi:MAG: NAD-dependent epimerase/dehydratase family protein [Thermoanaerobaculaceae bacterium]